MNSAEPGPWDNDRTPYLREIMDAINDYQITEITVMASTQVGKTESIHNIIGYIVDQDPGPALYVQPREDDAFSNAHNRLRPMFRECKRLKKQIPSGRAKDLHMKEFRLSRMTIYFAGSNSPAGIAGKPIRYLFLDETDKYPRFSGREASPIKLASERTRTFRNSKKIIKVSTPTTEAGYIWREYHKTDQRKYYVPCPHCDEYQTLNFSQIKIPEEERNPERIRKKGIATYECSHCRNIILDRHKPNMLKKGKWVSKKQKIDKYGEVTGEDFQGRHAGFWINALYSPWLTWSEIIAEFLESKNNPEELMNFKNSWLAEVWKEDTDHSEVEHIIKNKADYPSNRVPEGATVLTAGVDVQKHVLFYVVRAWGPGMRSWLIDEGELDGDSLEILDEVILNRYWPWVDSDDMAMNVQIMNVDSGYRTDEVYDYCRMRAGRARPIKGAGKSPQRIFWATMVDSSPITGKKLKYGGIKVWMLDTEFYKDFIFRRMGKKEDDEYGWHYHRDISLDYAEQITSEHRVTLRRGRYEYEEWQPRYGKARNHLWDAEVYACAGAHMLRRVIEKGVIPKRTVKEVVAKKQAERAEKKSGWLPSTEGWLR